MRPAAFFLLCIAVSCAAVLPVPRGVSPYEEAADGGGLGGCGDAGCASCEAPENGGPTAIYAFNTGVAHASASHAVVDGPDVLEPTPFYAFVIDTPGGLIVFDTGIAPELLSGNEAAYFNRLFMGGLVHQAVASRHLLPRRLQHQRDLATQLEALKLNKPVKLIVISHVHFDHTGDVGALLKLYPEAKVVVGPEDFDRSKGNCLQNVAEACSWGLDFQAVTQPALPGRTDPDRFVSETCAWLGEGWRLNGFPGVHLLRTPGHTPGSQSLLVDLPHGPVLLPGDAAYVRLNIDVVRAKGKGADEDHDRAWQTLYTLHEAQLRIRGLRIFPAHEPDPVPVNAPPHDVEIVAPEGAPTPPFPTFTIR